jgi:DNA repair exonuclease SbcCD ATPase subunit
VQLRQKPSPVTPSAAADPRLAGAGPRAERVRVSDTRRLPSLPREGDDWYEAPNAAHRHELAEELDGMAEQLGEVDPRAAERLRDLAASVASEEGRARWSDVDLRRAFNTERLSQAYAIRHAGRFAASAIEQADRVRNVLVLVPILLTWFALAEASKAYDRYLAEHPEMVREPFLLLWQRGFGGESAGFAPTFSMVAVIDALIIAAIIGLTFYAHGRREARDDQIEEVAGRFQTDLDNVLAEATVVLAGDRGSRPAMLARSVERLAERFDRSSQELLTRLRVEHDRLEQLATRREKEFADFGVFASGMRAGAEETHRLLVDLRQVSTSLQSALEDLTSEVSVTTDQQRSLLSAVQNLERLTSTSLQSDQAVTRQIGSAATTLAEAADRSLAGAEAAAQAARVATEAVRGIADVASTLAVSQGRLENAMAAESEANTRLADALRSGAGGVSASTKSLQEIGTGLGQLRDELGDIAAQSARQASALGQLLSDQGEIANGLSQVARDLSAVGIATAQRQREVNEDVSVLLSRLDGLTTLLARATATAPTPDALAQAFTGALRNELSAQADLIADAMDARGHGHSLPVAAGPPAPRSRGGWPRDRRT